MWRERARRRAWGDRWRRQAGVLIIITGTHRELRRCAGRVQIPRVTELLDLRLLNVTLASNGSSHATPRSEQQQRAALDAAVIEEGAVV